jgi:hypothetical protein
MTPSRWQQIEELYHAALERNPSERAALLARADPGLRREVESLLAQGSGATHLEHPAWEGAASLLGLPEHGWGRTRSKDLWAPAVWAKCSAEWIHASDVPSQ